MSGKNLHAMANGLVEETLVEAATTFFGARKALEDEIELYHRRSGELVLVEEGVLRCAAALHSLLPGREAVLGLYAALDVRPGQLLDAALVVEPYRGGVDPSLALTPSGRYANLVLAAYAALVDAADLYLHGRHDDGERGRKVLTVNYTQLHDWCRILNKKVEALNHNHSPSGTMCFIKGLDPGQLDRSRLSDATIDGYATELDKELAFKPVECLAMNLLASPELPSPAAAESRLRAYAKGLYAKDSGAVKPLMEAWKRAVNED